MLVQVAGPAFNWLPQLPRQRLLLQLLLVLPALAMVSQEEGV